VSQIRSISRPRQFCSGRGSQLALAGERFVGRVAEDLAEVRVAVVISEKPVRVSVSAANSLMVAAGS